MAVGLSGSNAGISTNYKPKVDLSSRPLEISYFVNNICNLECKHCYVGYGNPRDPLSLKEWTKTFDKLIELGALTFGNVGKEPLFTKEYTLGLLEYFAKKRKTIPKLRFGLVTNGTLLSWDVAEQLDKIQPTYIDVSLDGPRERHDFIRGEGSYNRTYHNLKELTKRYPKLAEKMFISFTLMLQNQHSIDDLVQEIQAIDLKKLLISPYVRTEEYAGLDLTDEEVAKVYQDITQGKRIDFTKFKQGTVLLKTDFDANPELIKQLKERKVIDLTKLLIDDYGTIFNRYSQANNSNVFVNFIPFSETGTRAIRISHDGYVGGCLEMFHRDYPKRARGNIRDTPIEDLII